MAGRPATEILTELEPLGVRLGLDTFRRLLVALGSPQESFPSILVAGTNGKGSVAAMLDAIGRAAGLRVGLYTSPHLESYSERVRVGGDAILEDRLAHHLERVLAAAETAGLLPPTVFEALTAVALLEFSARAVDLAVLEVGLGGRLDATNAVEPVISVITRVAIDHRSELGESAAAIAREKAGILRPGRPAVFGRQDDDVDRALSAEARRLAADVRRVAGPVVVERAEWRGLDGHRLRLRAPRGTYEIELPLAGVHQVDNAATAVRTAELLAERWPRIDGPAIERGLAEVRWPGRLEALTPSGGRTTWLLDAAHNPDGCSALAAFLTRLGSAFDLVFGCLADKDVSGMLPPLTALARRVVLTRPPSPRAGHPETWTRWVPTATAFTVVDVARVALDTALADRPRLLVVAGSIYLVAEARREALTRQARASAR